MRDHPTQLDLFSQVDIKNIAITGCSGFVGSHLKTAFQRRGWNVVCVPRKALEDQNALLKIFTEADVVINLSGENIGKGVWSQRKKDRIYNSRIESTKKIVEALNHPTLSPKVFVSTSALGIYGSNCRVKSEDDSLGDDFLARVCKDWESQARRYQKGRVIITRFGVVMSEKGGMLAKLIRLTKSFLLTGFGHGENKTSWICIEDLCDGIAFCIKHKEIDGAINFCTEIPFSNKELVKLLSERFRRPAFFSIPEFLIKVFFKEKGELLLLANQEVRPDKLLKAGYVFKMAKITDIFRSVEDKPLKVK